LSDPAFRTRVKASFSRQPFMTTIGASLELVEPGEVHIALPFSAHLSQQHGYLHAGATTAIADSANGYAALTLAPADAEVLAVEFKINLMAPASAGRFLARGRVLRSGRRLERCGSGGNRDHALDDQHPTRWRDPLGGSAPVLRLTLP